MCLCALHGGWFGKKLENALINIYMRAQGPNVHCMDYHDLSTKLYSPALLRVWFHVLFIGHIATINTGCTNKLVIIGPSRDSNP